MIGICAAILSLSTIRAIQEALYWPVGQQPSRWNVGAQPARKRAYGFAPTLPINPSRAAQMTSAERASFF